MSAQAMPYWFTKLTEKPRLLATVTDGVSVGDFELHLWREISKPENLAKFPEVAKLIETAQQTRQDIDTILKVRTEITIAMAEGHINDLDDALKPFKKEGSDEKI